MGAKLEQQKIEMEQRKSEALRRALQQKIDAEQKLQDFEAKLEQQRIEMEQRKSEALKTTNTQASSDLASSIETEQLKQQLAKLKAQLAEQRNNTQSGDDGLVDKIVSPEEKRRVKIRQVIKKWGQTKGYVEKNGKPTNEQRKENGKPCYLNVGPNYVNDDEVEKIAKKLETYHDENCERLGKDGKMTTLEKICKMAKMGEGPNVPMGGFAPRALRNVRNGKNPDKQIGFDPRAARENMKEKNRNKKGNKRPVETPKKKKGKSGAITSEMLQNILGNRKAFQDPRDRKNKNSRTEDKKSCPLKDILAKRRRVIECDDGDDSEDKENKALKVKRSPTRKAAPKRSRPTHPRTDDNKSSGD